MKKFTENLDLYIPILIVCVGFGFFLFTVISCPTNVNEQENQTQQENQQLRFGISKDGMTQCVSGVGLNGQICY